jgi:hypothetical protein
MFVAERPAASPGATGGTAFSAVHPRPLRPVFMAARIKGWRRCQLSQKRVPLREFRRKFDPCCLEDSHQRGEARYGEATFLNVAVDGTP